MKEYQQEHKSMASYMGQDAFCFILKQEEVVSEKTQRFKQQGWESLRNNPAYPTLLKYKDTVFKEKLPEPGKNPQSSDIQHVIELEDATPFAVKQFRLSPDQQRAVAEWVDEMKEAGLIRRSTSPFNSPIFCVKKAYWMENCP